MEHTMKQKLLIGVLLPAAIFILHGVISLYADPFGVVLTDIFIKIPVMFAIFKLVQKFRPVEKKEMTKKKAMMMLAIFAVAICIPTQLMSHATASIGSPEGLEMFPKSLITAPILEEIVYRGLLFGIARTMFGFWPSTIISLAFFQFAHITPSYIVITVPLTVASSAMYEITGNLKYSMWMHSVFNFIAFLFVFVKLPVMIVLPIYAIVIAVLILMVIKRNNIGRKLGLKKCEPRRAQKNGSDIAKPCACIQ